MRLALYFLAGSLAFFCAGFLWTLGTDTANRIIIRRQRSRREAHKREVERIVRTGAKWEQREGVTPRVLYVADARAARWTVQ